MFPGFLAKPADEVAQKLLGCLLQRTINGKVITVRIVETEAYDQEDAASHAYNGETQRNKVMYGPSGHLYVYFTYGMHYCCNVVTGDAGYGAGVLIRGVEPIDGRAYIAEQRGMVGPQVTNGPAKLCKALSIDMKLSGHDLRKAPLQLLSGSLLPGETITQATRIGISKEKEQMRRFYITGNPFVSRY